MMKACIIAWLLILSCYLATAATTAGALPYAGSFILRAQGSEALYWNPANISAQYQDVVLPGMNIMVSADNNSFDLDTYNYICGRYLNEEDKLNIMDKVDNSLKANSEAGGMLLGLTLGRVAFSTAMHSYGNLRLSEDYLQLALFGNEEEDYYFNKADNQINAISYQDVSIGFGSLELSPIIGTLKLPTTYWGVSGSALLGYGIAQTEIYQGLLHTGFDGVTAAQELLIKAGIGGIGGKLMLGMRMQPLPNLTVGASLDNIMGHITWIGKKDMYTYSVRVDSVYVADLEEDYYDQDESSVPIGDFTTKLPPEVRLGALYGSSRANISIDWMQAWSGSQLTDGTGVLSWAAEINPIQSLLFVTGMKFGNADQPWLCSYGMGFRGQNLDGMFGCQAFGSLLPGYRSKGVAVSVSLKIHY